MYMTSTPKTQRHHFIEPTSPITGLYAGIIKTAACSPEKILTLTIPPDKVKEGEVSLPQEIVLALQHQPEARVDESFNTAKSSGLFDPLVFPRIRKLMSET